MANACPVQPVVPSRPSQDAPGASVTPVLSTAAPPSPKLTVAVVLVFVNETPVRFAFAASTDPDATPTLADDPADVAVLVFARLTMPLIRPARSLMSHTDAAAGLTAPRRRPARSETSATPSTRARRSLTSHTLAAARSG